MPKRLSRTRTWGALLAGLLLTGCKLLLVNGERWDAAVGAIQAWPSEPNGYFERGIQNDNAWQWEARSARARRSITCPRCKGTGRINGTTTTTAAAPRVESHQETLERRGAGGEVRTRTVSGTSSPSTTSETTVNACPLCNGEGVVY